MTQGVRFRTRGDNKTYQIQIKHNDFDNITFYFATFRAMPEWHQIDIPWRAFHANVRARDVGASTPDTFQTSQIGNNWSIYFIYWLGFGIEKQLNEKESFWLEMDQLRAYSVPQQQQRE